MIENTINYAVSCIKFNVQGTLTILDELNKQYGGIIYENEKILNIATELRNIEVIRKCVNNGRLKEKFKLIHYLLIDDLVRAKDNLEKIDINNITELLTQFEAIKEKVLIILEKTTVLSKEQYLKLKCLYGDEIKKYINKVNDLPIISKLKYFNDLKASIKNEKLKFINGIY